MSSNARGILILIVGTICALTGCGATGERCRKCGMLVDNHPRWVAGLENASGKEERFCCPRCMFSQLRGPRGAGCRACWVTEYYDQKRTPIDEVFFVAGSNVIGPMGKSLVPIRGRVAAERFLKDHQGNRILLAPDIDLRTLKEIAGKPVATESPLSAHPPSLPGLAPSTQ